MDKKIIKTISLEGLKLEVIETDKGLKVNIEGSEMEVFINGESFFEPYEEDEYKFIPPNIRPFVKKYFSSCGEFEDKDGKIGFEACINGYDYYTKIPKKRGKTNVIEMINDLESYELLYDYRDKKIPKGKENFEKLIQDIEDIGYKLRFSHGGNETYHYYSLIIPIGDFDEEKILKCSKIWLDYNKTFEKYLK